MAYNIFMPLSHKYGLEAHNLLAFTQSRQRVHTDNGDQTPHTVFFILQIPGQKYK